MNSLPSTTTLSEFQRLHGFDIHQRQSSRLRRMRLSIRPIFNHFTQIVNVRKIECFGFGDLKDFLSFDTVQEFSVFIQQFQGIPLFWIVGSGKSDATVGTFERNSHFHRWRRGKSQIDYVDSKTHQGIYHQNYESSVLKFGHRDHDNFQVLVVPCHCCFSTKFHKPRQISRHRAEIRLSPTFPPMRSSNSRYRFY